MTCRVVRWLVALALLLVAVPVWAAPAFVNAVGDAPGNGSTVASGAISHTASNGLVAFVRWTDLGTESNTGVTNTAGDTWTQCPTNSPFATGSTEGSCWYVCSTAGNASDDTTAAFTGLVFNPSILVFQFSGTASSSCVDSFPAGASGFGTTATSSSFTTATAATIVINVTATVATVTSSTIAGSSSTIPSGGTTTQFTGAYRVLSATVSGQTADMSWTGNADWAPSWVIAFKGATGGGATCKGAMLRGLIGC